MHKLSFLVLSTVVVMLFCCGNQHDIKATENGEEKIVSPSLSVLPSIALLLYVQE